MEKSHFLQRTGVSLKASAGFRRIDNTHFIISIRKLPSGKHHLSSIEALRDNITMLPTMGRPITEGQADPVDRDFHHKVMNLVFVHTFGLEFEHYMAILFKSLGLGSVISVLSSCYPIWTW